MWAAKTFSAHRCSAIYADTHKHCMVHAIKSTSAVHKQHLMTSYKKTCIWLFGLQTLIHITQMYSTSLQRNLYMYHHSQQPKKIAHK